MIKAKKIEINEKASDIAYWRVEGSMNNDWTLVAEVEYIDIYSAGYVYNITAYCLDTGIKVIYQRVKSHRSLMTDNKAIEEYFENGGTLCKSMCDFGILRKNMSRKEIITVQDMLAS